MYLINTKKRKMKTAKPLLWEVAYLDTLRASYFSKTAGLPSVLLHPLKPLKTINIKT